YASLQELLRRSGTSVVSNFNDRPSRLFDGLEHIRLCIILHELRSRDRKAFSTAYNKWRSVERPYLFQRLTFAETTDLNRGGTWAKVGSPIEASLLLKCNRDNRVLGDHLRKNGNSVIYYTRKLSHFVQILDFTPSITDERGQKRPPSELKELWFSEPAARDVFLAILNSTQFYWLLTVFSDCRNLNKREVLAVRFDFGKARPDAAQRLADLNQILMKGN